MRAALTARTMTSRGLVTELTGHATPLAAADTIPGNSYLNTYSGGKSHVCRASRRSDWCSVSAALEKQLSLNRSRYLLSQELFGGGLFLG
jgi:hypothetical protein